MSKLLFIPLSCAFLIATGLWNGCRTKPTPQAASNPRAWFIESWDNGVLTVQHAGNSYKATCDISRSFNNAASITDEKNVHVFSTCDLAVDLVGHNVQPFDGKQRDADGNIVVMWNVGNNLAVRRWKDEHAPFRQEEFRITSVTKAP